MTLKTHPRKCVIDARFFSSKKSNLIELLQSTPTDSLSSLSLLPKEVMLLCFGTFLKLPSGVSPDGSFKKVPKHFKLADNKTAFCSHKVYGMSQQHPTTREHLGEDVQVLPSGRRSVREGPIPTGGPSDRPVPLRSYGSCAERLSFDTPCVGLRCIKVEIFKQWAIDVEPTPPIS